MARYRDKDGVSTGAQRPRGAGDPLPATVASRACEKIEQLGLVVGVPAQRAHSADRLAIEPMRA
jgi:hypothetical protein